MAAKGGKNFLLKKDNPSSPGSYVTCGGLKSKSMKLNNDPIDVSNHGSNEWKEILDGAGLKSMSISGSGVFVSGSNLAEMITDLMNGTLRSYQIVDADSGLTLQGSFKITSFEQAGEFDGAMTWAISLESSGAVSSV